MGVLLRQPVVTGKQFLSLIDPMAEDLKKLFTQIAADAQRIASNVTVLPDLERSLVGLFEEDHRDHLKKIVEYRGRKYAGLIQETLVKNQKRISGSILNSDRKRLLREFGVLDELAPEKTAVIVPEINYALQRSSVLIKAADNGRMISQTRREDMRKIIKNVMMDQPVHSQSGGIAPEIADKVKTALKEYFEGYTKNSPPYGIPRNLQTIAVTESRSLLNNVRHEYMGMADQNLPDGFETDKTWRHNASLSKVPRRPHKAMNGQTIRFGEVFVVNGFAAKNPHDYNLPASETISCNCDSLYTIRKVATKKPQDQMTPNEYRDYIFDFYKQRGIDRIKQYRERLSRI